ncbi:hypothetical protein CROQUDRAFT_674568 [Cronartium quercuum f. sp. fusiforme G11]|uniref:Uncharacterized protein n=1 Tax=Cronartium quercuum f. sp. fusiforme G11 TaxID=708437 RepID=A0A9P6T629_9BASI|nr:hypothetical protein CROQUDRAFT_674568 [Cronartium quercuum f. sp. fusiforme G11]
MLGRLQPQALLHHLHKREGGDSSDPSSQSAKTTTTSHNNTNSEIAPWTRSAPPKTYAAHNDTRVAKDSSEWASSRDSSHWPDVSATAHKEADDQVSSKKQFQSKQQTSFKSEPSSRNQTSVKGSTTHANATQSETHTNSTEIEDSNSGSDLGLTMFNSTATNVTATLRDQSQLPTGASLSPSGLPPPDSNSSSAASVLQTQKDSEPSNTHHKPSTGAICGIVFGIIAAMIFIGFLGFCLKSYKRKHRHYGNRYHLRNHSSTDSNKAVRDRSSFTGEFGAHDPFAGPPESARTAVRRSDGFPRGDWLGFGLGKCPSRRPSYLNLARPDIKPQISAPIIEHPPPLMHRSLSSHSAGVPVSCMSAVVRRMSSNAQPPQNQPYPFRRESSTRDPYHQRGSVLSVRNPDIEEDRITIDDDDEPKRVNQQVQLNHHPPSSSELHYQDLPVGSTSDSDESLSQRRATEKSLPVSQPYRRSPWGELDPHSVSNESSSFVPEHNPTELEEGEAIFSGPEIMRRTQAAIDAHISHLSRSTRYSQDSEERLEVESPTDPAVRLGSATPTSLVFVSFGADRRSTYSERSRHSFQAGPLQATEWVDEDLI